MRKAVKEDKYICCDETYHKILFKAGENDGRFLRTLTLLSRRTIPC